MKRNLWLVICVAFLTVGVFGDNPGNKPIAESAPVEIFSNGKGN